jgi:hypothetical protein
MLEREREIVLEPRFTHGERKSLRRSFYPDLSKTQLFMRLMGKHSPMAGVFCAVVRKRQVRCAKEGEQGPFFFAVGRNPCAEVREGK